MMFVVPRHSTSLVISLPSNHPWGAFRLTPRTLVSREHTPKNRKRHLFHLLNKLSARDFTPNRQREQSGVQSRGVGWGDRDEEERGREGERGDSVRVRQTFSLLCPPGLISSLSPSSSSSSSSSAVPRHGSLGGVWLWPGGDRGLTGGATLTAGPVSSLGACLNHTGVWELCTVSERDRVMSGSARTLP